MIYKQETLGLKEGMALVLVGTIARIAVTSMSGIVSASLQGAWIGVLLNGFATLFILSLLYALYGMTGCKGDLHRLAQQILGKFLGSCVTLWILLNIFENTALLLRQYGENTIVTSMPHLDLEVSIWLYTIVAGILVHFGLTGISRATRLFMPLIVCTFLGIGAFLYPFYLPYRLFPWQGMGLQTIFSSGVTGISYNFLGILVFIFLPFFSRLDIAFQAGLKGIYLSVALKIVMVVTFIMSYGVEAGSEKMMPFYEMSRLIFLSRYFQHIEALLILFWVILGILAIALNLYIVMYLFCRLFKLEDGKVVLWLCTLCSGTVALLPSNFGQALLFEQKYVLQTYVTAYGIPLLMFIVQFWQQRKSRFCKG